MSLRANLARNLRRLCNGRGRSIKAICEDMEINRNQFDKYLNGLAIPSQSSLTKICAYFGISEEDLFQPEAATPQPARGVRAQTGALTQACADHQITFILPAHGHVLGQAAQAIAQLKAHRLQREAKVLAAMRAAPAGSMEDWVALAYDDVPPRMWPVAQRSLLAHVQRIQALQGNP